MPRPWLQRQVVGRWSLSSVVLCIGLYARLLIEVRRGDLGKAIRGQNEGKLSVPLSTGTASIGTCTVEDSRHPTSFTDVHSSGNLKR